MQLRGSVGQTDAGRVGEIQPETVRRAKSRPFADQDDHHLGAQHGAISSPMATLPCSTTQTGAIRQFISASFGRTASSMAMACRLTAKAGKTIRDDEGDVETIRALFRKVGEFAARGCPTPAKVRALQIGRPVVRRAS